MSRHSKTYSQPSVHKSRYEIIMQRLQTVNTKKHGNVKSFELVYRCNLTWPQFKAYKTLLIRREFLLITSIPDGHAQRYNHIQRNKIFGLFEEIENYLLPDWRWFRTDRSIKFINQRN